MPNIRLTGKFEMRTRNWTETHVRLVSSTDLDAAFTQSLPLWSKRAQCLGTEAIIFGVRVSLVDSPRRARTFNVNLAGVQTAGWSCTSPDDAIDIQNVTADDQFRRNIAWRGCPDGIITDGGLLNIDNGIGPAWFVNFGAWSAEMIALLYGWMGRDVYTNGMVTTYTRTTAGYLDLITAPGFFTGVPVGNRVPVRLKDVNGVSLLNREWVAIVLSDNTFRLKGQIAVPEYAGLGGTVSRWTEVLRVGNGNDIQKVGRRPAGRPLSLTPGRGKARIYR
jgi:hypothetical protein